MALFEMTGDELRALEVTTFKNEAVQEPVMYSSIVFQSIASPLEN